MGVKLESLKELLVQQGQVTGEPGMTEFVIDDNRKPFVSIPRPKAEQITRSFGM